MTVTVMAVVAARRGSEVVTVVTVVTVAVVRRGMGAAMVAAEAAMAVTRRDVGLSSGQVARNAVLATAPEAAGEWNVKAKVLQERG